MSKRMITLGEIMLRLDPGEGPDLGGFQATSRDREVLHRPLCLRAPQGVGRHPDLAHRVPFDPVATLLGSHPTIVPPGAPGRS